MRDKLGTLYNEQRNTEAEMNNSNLPAKRSGYYSNVVDIAGELDYDISKFNQCEQIDQLGMAIETAYNNWERGLESEYFDSEKECVAAYFGGAFEQESNGA